MYFVAMRTASIATSKQSVAVAAASTASGASAFRPCTACSRSDCSALVGMPVDGPARWESTTTSGSSVAIARPSISVLSAKPGPEVDVTPSAPAYAAPIAAVHPQHQPERPHVAAAVRFPGLEPGRFDRVERKLGDVELEHLVGSERPVVQRVGREPRFGEVALGERAQVDDHGAADPQVP